MVNGGINGELNSFGLIPSGLATADCPLLTAHCPLN